MPSHEIEWKYNHLPKEEELYVDGKYAGVIADMVMSHTGEHRWFVRFKTADGYSVVFTTKKDIALIRRSLVRSYLMKETYRYWRGQDRMDKFWPKCILER